MLERSPKIDGRNAACIAEQVKTLLKDYAPEWKANEDRLGSALITIFARFAELIIERLNRVPEKQLLAFLDLLGAAPLPPQPARAPLAFSLAEGTTDDVVVPAGTPVAAAPITGSPRPVVFETEHDLVVTAAGLNVAFVHDAARDRYARITRSKGGAWTGAQGGPVQPFGGDREIEHAVYIGHRTLFAYPGDQQVQITLELDKTVQDLGQRRVVWEIWSGKEWVEKAPAPDSTNGLKQPGTLTFALSASIPELQLDSVTSRWLRCRLTAISQASKSLPAIPEVKVTKLELGARRSVQGLRLDAAFADASPLDLSKDFFPFGERPRFGNVFYLASREAFSHSGAQVALSIVLSDPAAYVDLQAIDAKALGARSKPKLSWEYWDGRSWQALTVTDSTGTFTKPGKDKDFTAPAAVTFRVPQGIEPNTVNGIESHWIRVRITDKDYGQEAGASPFSDAALTGEITGSSASFTGEARSPATGAKGKINGLITGNTITGTVTGTITGTLSGTGTDTTLTAMISASMGGPISGTVTGQINGTIDKQKKVTGSVTGMLTGYQIFPATLVPPSIQAVTVGYEVKPEARVAPEVILSYNDFVYEDITRQRPFVPFRGSADKDPSLYLGFSLPPGRSALPNNAVSLYFAIPEVTDAKPAAGPADPPVLAWEYWDHHNWVSLAVHDETESLRHSGIVACLLPADSIACARFGVSPHHWLRVRLDRGQYPDSLEIRRVALNTVMASHSMTIVNEVLGSSDEGKGQRFRLNQAPVLPGQRLEVRAPDQPPGAEYTTGGGQDVSAAAAPSATGRAQVVWIPWHEVPDFYDSGPQDRHHVLDHLTGEVRFGDGAHGRVPPRGSANIRMARYRNGGGAVGNQPAGAIGQLKTTVPHVDKVTNLEPATGGADAETLEALEERAPQAIRHRGRAVTQEDYEDLALLASPEVARARCVPPRNPKDETEEPKGGGQIRVIVLPRSADAQPTPSLELRRRVQTYLDNHRFPGVALSVVGPRYAGVDVEAEVAPSSIDAASHLEASVREALTRFLHPLTGGFEGTGWPWGRWPQKSGLYRWIERVPGVDHVHTLTVSKKPELDADEDTFLVYSGTHTISLKLEGLKR